jgi:hypothetical protein
MRRSALIARGTGGVFSRDPRRGEGEVSAPKVGDWVWHVHHEILVEPLTEPIENRIAYIKSDKSPEEVP